MFDSLLDPVIIFFVMGILARLCRVPLAIPEVIYETIAIYLLLAIGLKGGYELSQIQEFDFFQPTLGALAVGIVIPVVTFSIVKNFKIFSRDDAIALAAHYGAASAVTFAVVLNFFDDLHVGHENFFTLFLVLIEVVGILTAFSFLHLKQGNFQTVLKRIVHDVLLSKSIFLLLMGIFIGWISSVKGFQHVRILFIDLFKGALCFFMLEMGLICGRQLNLISGNRLFVLGFGLVMPVFSAVLAIFIAGLTGFSPAGATILATIAASASYIAAPAVTRTILPSARLAIPLACSLGVTFPFNVIVGIPLYYQMAQIYFGWIGS